MSYSIIQQIFDRKIILYKPKKESVKYKGEGGFNIPMNKDNILIITNMEFIDRISELKVDWILFLISDYESRYKKLKKNIKNLKFISPQKSKLVN